MDFTQLSDVLLKATKRSVKDFFQTMCPLALEEGLTYKEYSPDLNREKYEIVGLIALSGQIQGSVSVYTKTKLAQEIARNLLKKPASDMGTELNDVMGEIANIIAGSVKTWVHVNEGLDFNISCPSVVLGNQYLNVPSASRFIGHRFKVAGEDLLVNISINS